ncbi:MAG: hypothetical protein HYZ37_08615 [Candidatus Solibacter usitatus]|nr:hypothetical protein [Candidatus Solibacter usitatus]
MIQVIANLFLGVSAAAQTPPIKEARFEVPVTITGQLAYSGLSEGYPRSGSPFSPGFRAVLYPVMKLGRGWFVAGSLQGSTRPFFGEQLNTQGYGAGVDVLNAYLGYAHYRGRNFIQIKVGQLMSAFGSFPLRYDDTANALTGVPLSYGYYYKPVTLKGQPGAQVDVSLGRADFRAQFTASSPANRRGFLEKDQYGAWTGGAGYTILQGFRVGVSAHRGPYLHRQHRYFFPGEWAPKRLPSTGLGLDVQFARGHWNMSGELQRTQNAYHVIPTFSTTAGYGEVKYALHPRWYVAVRGEHLVMNIGIENQAYETAAAFRPNRRQLIKTGYQVSRGTYVRGNTNNVLSIQLITRLDDVTSGLTK